LTVRNPMLTHLQKITPRLRYITGIWQ
jgi:hypothetical protein